MTNKEKFIEELTSAVDLSLILSDESLVYWNDFVKGKASLGGMTEAGEKVLTWMLENEKLHSNVFSAKVIGEGLFIHARSVTGAMRKLIADGYVEKVGQNPVSYSLTDTARSWHN
jgi:hypothetical protein